METFKVTLPTNPTTKEYLEAIELYLNEIEKNQIKLGSVMDDMSEFLENNKEDIH